MMNIADRRAVQTPDGGKERLIVTNSTNIHFHISAEDKARLGSLPWHVPIINWPELGVQLLSIRRGESRHPVIFVESQGERYAIKETTPHMAEREIYNLREIEFRGIPTLRPTGWVVAPAPPIPLDVPQLGGLKQYMSGDRGYTITRLAPRVMPHVMLYRLPLTKPTKHRLLAAVAVLMVELHEHGVYWGDPSLANVLIRIDGRRILAIMADAETAELFQSPVGEALREQDMASFGESMAWQSEDLRQARSLPESEQVLDDSDYRYFAQRYRGLRKEHAYIVDYPNFHTFYQAQRFVRKLNRWGYAILEKTESTLHQWTAVLPGWYQRRIYELMHINVPRAYARRFYNLLIGHQIIMSRQGMRYVSIEEAARDWYERYHLPAILLLKRILTSDQDPMLAYFAVMEHKWHMSVKAGEEVPLDVAILEWSMLKAETGELGAIDPALLSKWWRELQPAAQVLEPQLISGDELDPLLSTGEKPLVHLQPPLLEQKLPEILERSGQDGEDRE